VIGTAFATLVSTFTSGLITPLIAALGKAPDFSALSFTINESKFRYRAFLNALVSLAITASVVFFFVVKSLNTLTARRKAGMAAGEETRKRPECISEIPARARRCAFCTAEVEPAGAPGAEL
jgi:large conductance mechanosensitive channel